MKTIIAAISVAIAAAFGAVRIYSVTRGDLPAVEKVKKVHAELARIADKLGALAATTEPAWDDAVAAAFSDALEVLAQALIDQLEEENS